MPRRCTRVVNVKSKVLRSREGRKFQNIGEWLAENDHVYVGRSQRITLSRGNRITVRQSKWHNPFRLGRSGVKTAADSVRRFREHIVRKIAEDPATYDLAELRGKELGCWCKPASCHGDVLKELVAARFGGDGGPDETGADA